MIYPGQQLVVRLGSGGKRLGPVLVWERSWDDGVPLGDAVKGDTGESYLFTDEVVHVILKSSDRPIALQIALPLRHAR
jgi:hypothetical protein